MKRRESDKPPGCVYARKKRYWWRGRLPNETKIRSRKITPRNSDKAILASPDNLKFAYEIVWGWWNDAAAQAEGRKRQTITVAELVARYLAHADGYYRRKDGTPTGEATNITYGTRLLVSKFGNLSADSIDVDHIDALQQSMIDANLARSTINKRINAIKRMYRWAAKKKHVPASSYHAVDVAENLKLGRSKAKETDDIKPADEYSVDITLKHMPPTLWRMVMLHLLTGARSTEICIMRPCDIDRSADVWVYTPAWHKEQHLGQPRPIPLGPMSQELLAPLLANRNAGAYCFTPAEAMADRRIEQRAHRKSRVQPSQLDRHKQNPKRLCRPRYDSRSYYTAIQHAWRKARQEIARQVGSQEGANRPEAVKCVCPTLAHWHPHQLRHSFLTKVKRSFGVEHARASGGHASLDATEIYLEKDLKAATDVARKMG